MAEEQINWKPIGSTLNYTIVKTNFARNINCLDPDSCPRSWYLVRHLPRRTGVQFVKARATALSIVAVPVPVCLL
jgi:hypothetical protein